MLVRVIVLNILLFPFIFSSFTHSQVAEKNEFEAVNVEDQFPFVCTNLSIQDREECAVEFRTAQRDIKSVKSELDFVECYRNVKNFEAKALTYINELFFAQEYSKLLHLYENIGMCLWSSNKFSEAKHYIDTIPALIYSLNLVKPEGILTGSGRILPADEIGMRWHYTRQYVRFTANILNSRHRLLCQGSDCMEKAWRVYQLGFLGEFSKLKRSSIISSSKNRESLTSLLNKRDSLRAQIGLMELARTEKFLLGAERWLNILKKKDHEISENIYQLEPLYARKESNEIPSITEVQSLLHPDEILLGYTNSIQCRPPVLWEIRKNMAPTIRILPRVSGGCTTSEMQDAIFKVRKMLQTNTPMATVKPYLAQLRHMLLDTVKLPPSGSTIILLVDEMMVGLPFELLPLEKGKLLGDIYKIKYIPSPGFLSYSRGEALKSSRTFPFMYAGIARNNHGSNMGQLSANQSVAMIAKGYTKSFVLQEADKMTILSNKDLKDVKYVHFLTHSALLLNHQLALSYGMNLNEGDYLTSADIVNKLPLSADTVFITACDTVGAEPQTVPPGESFSDLSLGILAAGAKRIVISRWPVEQYYAEKLVAKYIEYKEKQLLTVDAAFIRARNDIRKESGNPFDWAAWMLVSD